MNPLRVLIVDDEPAARFYLRSLISRHTDLEIVGEASHAQEALAQIQTHAPDLVFLDIQMPGGDGFKVMEALPPKALSPLFVFVTAHDAHALKAFQAHALDYLLKPFDEERFDLSLDRVRAQWRGRLLGTETSQILELLKELRPPSTLGSLSVWSKDHYQVIQMEDIDWISADDNYVRIHTKGQAYLMRDSLSRMEGRLDLTRFLRIHRSTIVNLKRIRALVPLPHGEYQVILEGGHQLVLSRRHRHRLESVLGPI